MHTYIHVIIPTSTKGERVDFWVLMTTESKHRGKLWGGFAIAGLVMAPSHCKIEPTGYNSTHMVLKKSLLAHFLLVRV